MSQLCENWSFVCRVYDVLSGSSDVQDGLEYSATELSFTFTELLDENKNSLMFLVVL